MVIRIFYQGGSMKVNEVPQDGMCVIETTMVRYAVNEEGKFEAVPSNGWEPGFHAMTNFQDEMRELTARARERVKNNQCSPLEYFMYNAVFDVDALAQYMGISKRIVRKHLTLKGFDKLNEDLLRRYAHVLHTDVETIRNFKSAL
jgi:hypothetical protein